MPASSSAMSTLSGDPEPGSPSGFLSISGAPLLHQFERFFSRREDFGDVGAAWIVRFHVLQQQLAEPQDDADLVLQFVAPAVGFEGHAALSSVGSKRGARVSEVVRRTGVGFCPTSQNPKASTLP